MMKTSAYFSLFASSLLLCGCFNDEKQNHGDKKPVVFNEIFDFATTKVCDLTVDYKLSGYTRPVDFELYDRYPFVSPDSRLPAGFEPLLRAYTDAQGVFTGKALIPSDLTRVYLRTSHLGAPSVVELPVDGNLLTFVMPKDEDRPAAAASRAPATYPADVNVPWGLPWNMLGVPQSNNGTSPVPDRVISTIESVFVEGDDLSVPHPEMFNKLSAMEIIQPGGVHRVKLTFVHSDGVALNSLCYYSYNKNSPPASVDDLHLIMALPNATFNGQGGGLGSGFSVDLKYWNGSGYVSDFPYGTVVGFCVIKDGFDPLTGNIKDNPRYYSDFDLTGGNQQFVTFANNGNANCIFGMEYTDRSTGASDNDFNDLVFYAETFPSGKGVPSGGVIVDPPVVTPDPDPLVTTYKGTLIFEDLWPNHGDFDMNDVVVEYTCKVHTGTDNKVIKVEDSFRPVNNGATIQNGFAYQYGVSPLDIKSMVKTTNFVVVRQKYNYRPIPWQVDANNFETGQAYANIMLFDDIRADYLADGTNIFDVVTEFNSPVDIATLGFPPYNPYAIILHGDGADPRNRELHLTSFPGETLYAPSGKASWEWFGTNDDKSVPAQMAFYISVKEYPFAIQIPKHGFVLAPERVKIDEVYPGFAEWAASHGAVNADWYDHPAL